MVDHFIPTDRKVFKVCRKWSNHFFPLELLSYHILAEKKKSKQKNSKNTNTCHCGEGLLVSSRVQAEKEIDEEKQEACGPYRSWI